MLINEPKTVKGIEAKILWYEREYQLALDFSDAYSKDHFKDIEEEFEILNRLWALAREFDTQIGNED